MSVEKILTDICPAGVQFMLEVMKYEESSLLPATFEEITRHFKFDLSAFNKSKKFGYRFLDYPAHALEKVKLLAADDSCPNPVSRRK